MSEDRETRDRLLKAGERLFAERGFKDVTVRQICGAAGANVASVNYHFGDKLGLYREVLQQATDLMREATDRARAEGAGQPPEEKLRLYIRLFFERILAPRHETIYRLLHREFDDPTAALDTFAEQAIRPRVNYLAGIIAELIGCDPSDERALRCAGSVQAQFVVYMPNPIARRLGLDFRGTPAEIDRATRHITEFSLAGIHAVAGAGAGPRGRRPPRAPRTSRHPARPKPLAP